MVTPEPEPGAYTVSGARGNTVSGRCAGCLADVTAEDAYVIRYSLSGKRGGIFHHACAPTGPDWYGLDAVEGVKET